MDWSKIPVWEIAVFALAITAVLIVFVLWYFFGYDLALVQNTNPTMQSSLVSILAQV